MNEQKTCTQCKISQSRELFNIRKASVDGLSPICRECKKINDRQYRKNNTDKVKARRKSHYDRNREESIQKTATWRKANKDKSNAWFRKNSYRYTKDKLQRTRDYRAKKVSQFGFVPKNSFKILIETYGHQCLSCGSEENLAIDHIVPISWGTPKTKLHDIRNFQFLCRSCNSRKHAKYIDYRPFKLMLNDMPTDDWDATIELVITNNG